MFVARLQCAVGFGEIRNRVTRVHHNSLPRPLDCTMCVSDAVLVIWKDQWNKIRLVLIWACYFISFDLIVYQTKLFWNLTNSPFYFFTTRNLARINGLETVHKRNCFETSNTCFPNNDDNIARYKTIFVLGVTNRIRLFIYEKCDKKRLILIKTHESINTNE